MKKAEDVPQRSHHDHYTMSAPLPEALASTYALLEQQLAAANLLLKDMKGNAMRYSPYDLSGPPNITLVHQSGAMNAHPMQTPGVVSKSGQCLPHVQPLMVPAPSVAPPLHEITKPVGVGHKRSREEVEQAARKQGATGG